MDPQEAVRPHHWSQSSLWRAPRQSVLTVSGQFNRVLDSVFYDTGALSVEERASIAEDRDLEGAVAVVPPARADQPIPFKTPWQFLREQSEGVAEKIDTIVVPGVGSSALGAVALARSVAAARRCSVAGIVAGFGLSDLISEALSGCFVLGLRNAWRNQLASIFDVLDLKDHVRDDETHAKMEKHFSELGLERHQYMYDEPDSLTLMLILSRLGAQIDVLVGHSKGNLSIENALEKLLELNRRGRSKQPVPTGIRIVTLGAVVDFPPEFTSVHQFLGTQDSLGLMNSRLFEPRSFVLGAGHTLNSDIPWHLIVKDALQRAGCC